MRLLLSGILFLLSLAFAIVSLPALIRGGRVPEVTTLAQVERDEIPKAQDLELTGVLVRTSTASMQRAEGRYYLPLVTEPVATELERGGTWRAPASRARGKLVVAELDFTDVAGKQLHWDETESGAGRIGTFQLSGVVKAPNAWSASAALLLEATTGFAPEDVLCIRHGENSFGRAGSATGVGMALVFAVLGLLLLRARARARAEARALAGPGGGFAWGGASAAVLGLAVVAARFADNAGKVAAVHGDEVARSLARNVAKHPDEDAALHRMLQTLEAVETGQSVAEAIGTIGGPKPTRVSLSILGGIERYQKESDGAFHLTSAEIRRRWSITGDAGTQRGAPSLQNVSHRRDLGEETRIVLQSKATGGLEARVTETLATPRGATVPQDFVLDLDLLRGSGEDALAGKPVDLAVSAQSATRFGAWLAEVLRSRLAEQFPAGKAGVEPEVVVASAFPASFHVRGNALEIEVGAVRLDVVLRPARSTGPR